MHEMGLIKDLVAKVRGLAREHGADRVTSVKVRLGVFCHCSPDHFREHFVEETKGTPAEGAALDIETSDDPNDPHAQDILLLSVDVPE